MKKTIILFISFFIIFFIGCFSKLDEDSLPSNSLFMLTTINGALDVTSTKNGVYIIEPLKDLKNSKIKYIDANTLKEVSLCSRAECNHDNETCTAFIDSSTPYIFASANGDTLFLLSNRYVDDVYKMSLYKMDRDGHNKKLIFDLPSSSEFMMPSLFCEYDNKLYFILFKIDETLDQKEIYSIFSIDYNTLKEETIAEFNSFTNFLGVSNNDIILEQKINSDSGYYSEILSLNLVDYTINKLYTGPSVSVSNFISSYIYDNNLIYEISNNNGLKIFTINPFNSAKSELTLSSNILSNSSFSVYGVFDNHVIIGFHNYEKGSQRIAVNLLNGEVVPLDLLITGEDTRKAYVTILAEINDNYYVAVESKLSEFYYLTKYGTYSKGRKTILNNAFIDKSDYYNNIPNYRFSEKID